MGLRIMKVVTARDERKGPVIKCFKIAVLYREGMSESTPGFPPPCQCRVHLSCPSPSTAL
jgi:hypothetical protein